MDECKNKARIVTSFPQGRNMGRRTSAGWCLIQQLSPSRFLPFLCVAQHALLSSTPSFASVTTDMASRWRFASANSMEVGMARINTLIRIRRTISVDVLLFFLRIYICTYSKPTITMTSCATYVMTSWSQQSARFWTLYCCLWTCCLWTS